MQGQTHRKPGPPMRNFDQHELMERDREIAEHHAIHTTVNDHTLVPTREDAERIGRKRTSPIDPV
ncbi:hypothetical protein C7445_10557 [Alicyclobacillus sacchari]|uniref:Uncharacterized protein n=1 Tax=Alicyclobacillus sacchari TaxID=392010 RepID=A0A4V3HEI0_9BACL|nr:hypothetical protein C7445_10557 [Alicyclobacillus sacchari]GMA55973.1 hypothetical protein GCM10025858_04760 [Alicyclobacillus sacchari]